MLRVGDRLTQSGRSWGGIYDIALVKPSHDQESSPTCFMTNTSISPVSHPAFISSPKTHKNIPFPSKRRSHRPGVFSWCKFSWKVFRMTCKRVAMVFRSLYHCSRNEALDRTRKTCIPTSHVVSSVAIVMTREKADRVNWQGMWCYGTYRFCAMTRTSGVFGSRNVRKLYVYLLGCILRRAREMQCAYSLSVHSRVL